MNWNCTESDRRLSDYLERLTTPEETAAFSAHIEQCPDCAALVARVGGTVRLMRAVEPVEPPAQIFNKIIAATSGKREAAGGWRRWMRPATIAWQPQFAMGAITVAASFLIIFHAANSSRAPQGFATLNPINLFRAADRQAHLTYAHTAKFVNDMRVVYEIESRLEPDEDQQAAPAPPPAEAPGSTSQPQSQSRRETAPRSSIRRSRQRSVYADFVSRDRSFDREALLIPIAPSIQVSTVSSETPEDSILFATRSHS